MLNSSYCDNGVLGWWHARQFLLVAYVGLIVCATRANAQSGVGGCTLNDHVYTCDGAAFQKALANATTIAIDTHNADGAARGQLNELVTKRLGKTAVAAGTPADLDFLMIPTSPEGVVNGSIDADLGTLRVYSVTSNGARGSLLWAETFSGSVTMPWPAVVRGLILQLRAHFHIK